MLFCDADVVVTVRILFFKLHHARAFAHGRRDTNQAGILLRHVAQPVTEYLGVSQLAGRRGLDTLCRIEFAWAVIEHRVGFCQFVTLPFLGDHMQKLWPLEMLQILQSGDQ